MAYEADCVLGDVNAVLEKTFCARLARGGSLRCVYDLFGCRVDDVFCVEVEDFLVLLPRWVVWVVLFVGVLLGFGMFLVVFRIGLFVVGLGIGWDRESEGGGQEGEEGEVGEVHC